MDEVLHFLGTHFAQEIAVITGAPIISLITICVLGAIMYFGMGIYYAHSLSAKDSIISILRARLENSDAPTQPLPSATAQPIHSQSQSPENITTTDQSATTEQTATSAPDTTLQLSSVEHSADLPDYQLEESSPDFRAVFQDLPNESFRVVNPEKDHFSHVAWVVGFTNRRQYQCIVRARLIFKVQWRAGAPIYIHRTVVNGTWLEGTGAEVQLADKETRYLILAVAKITNPAEWLSAEDHRLTAHARLGVEFRSLPLASITIEVTTTLFGGETKTFTFGANLRTLRALTDLRPAKINGVKSVH